MSPASIRASSGLLTAGYLVWRSEFERRNLNPAIFDLATNDRWTNTIAQTVLVMGISVVVDTGSINPIGFAGKPNRKIATITIHSKLALAARRFYSLPTK